jgi:hypothetical protein
MSVQDQARLGGVIALAMILALLLAGHRLGVLNAVSWLVILGGVVIVGEHAQFALSLALALQPAVNWGRKGLCLTLRDQLTRKGACVGGANRNSLVRTHDK